MQAYRMRVFVLYKGYGMLICFAHCLITDIGNISFHVCVYRVIHLTDLLDVSKEQD